MEGNAIGDAGVALAQAMKTKKTLPKIYLRRNIIGEAGNEAQQVSPASEAWYINPEQKRQNLELKPVCLSTHIPNQPLVVASEIVLRMQHCTALH